MVSTNPVRGLALGIITSLACGCGGGSSAPSVETTQPRGFNSPVAIPSITGPISDAGTLRGHPWGAADAKLSPLDQFGYVQEEYFYTGTAQGKARDGTLDGTTSGYTTRMLVARPKSAANFNGTVLVEWANVTGEIEMDVVWAQTYAELLREGYAYVALSVQQVGVETSPLALKFWDPIRYAPLNVPGDAYAWDIFSQGARALFATTGPQPLGNLPIKRIIGTGESQSAALLIPYINSDDSRQHVFDGFLVHTYPGVIRNDASVPVLMLLSETEKEGFTSPLGVQASAPDGLSVIDPLPYGAIIHVPPARTPPADFDNFRVWEIAGASHFDKQALIYVSALASRDLAGSPSYSGLPLGCTAAGGALYPSLFPSNVVDLGRINQLGMQRPARAALHNLNSWLITGNPPAQEPRITLNADGTIQRDAQGLAMGGIRMPVMQEPIGVNEGKDCIFFGRYTAFSDVAKRYTSQNDYLQHLSAAAQPAISAGTLLPPDLQEYLDEAKEETAGVWQ